MQRPPKMPFSADHFEAEFNSHVAVAVARRPGTGLGAYPRAGALLLSERDADSYAARAPLPDPDVKHRAVNARGPVNAPLS
jgi:hypothetical protein